MTDLNEAVKLGPDDYEAVFRRGCTWAVKGDLDKAVADYDAALKLDPAFAEARFNRALAYVAKDDMDRASADYREAVRYDPRTPDAYKAWGRSEDRQKREKAVDRLEAILQQAKDKAQARSQNGTKLHKEGDLAKAIAEYTSIGTLPALHRGLLQPRLGHRKQDDLPKAIADYTRAIRLDPKYVDAYANRGYAYYMQKDYERALADFDKILELDPSNARAKKSRELIVKLQSGE